MINKAGGRVRIIIMSEGATLQYPNEPDKIDIKRRETHAAVERLGGGELQMLGLPDMQLAGLVPSELVDPIAESVDEFSPEWVLTHSIADLNSDHRAVHEAARIATRPGVAPPLALMAYEVPSSSEFGYSPHSASLTVELTPDALSAKIGALTEYTTEVRPWPHGRSPEAVRAWAAVRGSSRGLPFGEGYELIWSVIQVE